MFRVPSSGFGIVGATLVVARHNGPVQDRPYEKPYVAQSPTQVDSHISNLEFGGRVAQTGSCLHLVCRARLSTVPNWTPRQIPFESRHPEPLGTPIWRAERLSSHPG